MLETGLKVVDLLTPYVRGGKIALFGGAGGQDRADPGDDQPHRPELRWHIGVRRRGERTREGNDLWVELADADVLKDTALVFGQMDEPPGTRMRVGLSALTMAEYFRDEQGQDVLLFIDNIFRFTQAGSEVSTLLGRMPSAVGYQPTLADEMGELQERITSTRGLHHLDAGGVRACRRLHRPGAGDDVRAPGRHHRAEPSVFSKGIFPAVDLASSSTILDPSVVGDEHYRVAQESHPNPAALQGPSGHHRDSRYRRARRRGQAVGAAGASHRALPVAEHDGGAVHGQPGSTVPLKETIEAFDKLSKGDFDHLPEQAFFLIGGLEDLQKKAESLGAKMDEVAATARRRRTSRRKTTTPTARTTTPTRMTSDG